MTDVVFFPVDSPAVIAYTLVRMVLGILFFYQAYDKIFRMGLRSVCAEVSKGCLNKGVPQAFSKLSVYTTSWFELAGGALLIAGLFTPFVLFLFALHLLLVTLAFSFLDGIWDMKHVFPRLVMLVFLLLMPLSINTLSLDNWLGLF